VHRCASHILADGGSARSGRRSLKHILYEERETISFLPLLFGCLFWLAGLAGFVLWIVLLINAFQGKYFKLAAIGDYAEKYANPAI
jgi:uncharacterized membrane protein